MQRAGAAEVVGVDVAGMAAIPCDPDTFRIEETGKEEPHGTRGAGGQNVCICGVSFRR